MYPASKGYITERVPIEQAQPLRRETLLVGGKHALGIDAVPRIALSREMVDQRRLVYDPHLPTRYEMREVVILLEPFARLGDAVLDIFDFAPQLYQLRVSEPTLVNQHGNGRRAGAAARRVV